MDLYLSRWTVSADGAFTPLAGGPEGQWVGSVIDLRPRGDLIDGWCLVERATPLNPVPAGVHHIAAGWDFAPNRQVTRQVEAELGLARDVLAGMTVAQMTRHVLHVEGDDARPDRWNKPHPRKDGRTVIRCGSRLVMDEQTHAPRPSTVTYDESWPTNGTLTGTNQDLDWTALDTALSAWSIASGIADYGPPSSFSVCTNRAEHATDSDDNYAQAVIAALERGSGAAGQASVGCRGSNAAATYYYCQIERTSGGAALRLRKRVAGASTNLTSDVPVTWAAGGTLRVQVDGSELSGSWGGVDVGPITDTEITAGRYGYLGAFHTTHLGNGADLKVGAVEVGDLSAGGGTVSGSGAAVLPAVAGAGAGAVRVAGAGAAQLPTAAAAGAGAVVISGSGAAAVPAAAASGTGTVGDVVHGAGAAQLPALEGAGQGSVLVAGAGAAVLPATVGSGAGLVEAQQVAHRDVAIVTGPPATDPQLTTAVPARDLAAVTTGGPAAALATSEPAAALATSEPAVALATSEPRT